MRDGTLLFPIAFRSSVSWRIYCRTSVFPPLLMIWPWGYARTLMRQRIDNV